MTVTLESLYAQLGQLLEEMPDLAAPGAVTREANKWMARAAVLVGQTGDRVAAISLQIAARNMNIDLLRPGNAQEIAAIVHHALATVEAQLPAGARGSFIAAGSVFDAYQGVGKVLVTAASDVLIIDAYAGHEVLEYALATPEGRRLRVLADQARYQKSLKPAGEKWWKQFGASRLLEMRLTAPKALHDRLIIVDQKTVWNVGQSFNALAARAHTSISRLEPQIATQKIEAYLAMWSASSPL